MIAAHQRRARHLEEVTKDFRRDEHPNIHEVACHSIFADRLEGSQAKLHLRGPGLRTLV